jgi:hypothetical protein
MLPLFIWQRSVVMSDPNSVDASVDVVVLRCFHCNVAVTTANLAAEAPECCELHEKASWCTECMYGPFHTACTDTCGDCNAKLYCEKYTCTFKDEDDGVICGATMCRACHEEDPECSLHKDERDASPSWWHY